MESTEKWPNFFIVGAPKAGTTSLYAYLKDIPGIYMSPLKEPRYFLVGESPKHHYPPIRDKKKYLELFEKALQEKIIGEASPQYLSDPQTPKLIHQIIPQAKILISLRDPVESLFSNHLMLVRNGRTKITFSEQIDLDFNKITDEKLDIIRRDYGLYSENVKHYLKIFGPKQVKIIIFEEFIKNPKETINDILKFLDIKYELQYLDDKVFNKYGVVRGSVAQTILSNNNIRRMAEKFFTASNRRFLREKLIVKYQSKPEMESKDRAVLRKFYYDDVQKLQKILGRELPWSNFKN